MATLSQPDDNMIPGQTYTFQLKCTDWIEVPSTNTVQQDLTNNAPSFVQNLQVTSPFTTSLYNCQFTYNGDGSDVISDVASSLIAACLAGSNDNFSFVGAVPDTAQTITVSPTTAAQNVADTVGQAVNSAITGAAKTAATATQTVLTPIEVAVGIVALLLVVLIFTAGKSGGIDVAGIAGIGGSK